MQKENIKTNDTKSAKASANDKSKAKKDSLAPRPPANRVPKALSIIVCCLAILYYVTVILGGDLSHLLGDPKKTKQRATSLTPAATPVSLRWPAMLDGLVESADMPTVHTEHLPHLAEMLAARLAVGGASEKGLNRRIGVAPSEYASRLSASVEELSRLMDIYDSERIEDAEAISEHKWQAGGGGSLPHDVMLLGELVSYLSSALRQQLFLNAEDTAGSASVSSTVPALTLDQQLLTLCHAEANMLPHYYLLMGYTTAHLEALLNAADCLRVLRDEVVGVVIPVSKTLSQKSRKGSLFGSCGQHAKQQKDVPVDPESDKALKSHAALESELNQLLLQKEVSRPALTSVVTAFAKSSVCSGGQSSTIDAPNPKLLDQQVCTARFEALALPAGLDAKIASLLEEAIAIDSQYLPFRVQYLAHVTLGMARCGTESIEAIGRELKAQRTRVAATPLFRQWFTALKDVCQRNKALVFSDGLDTELDLAADQATVDLVKRFPHQPDDTIIGYWKARGLTPRPLLADREYRRFILLAKAMTT